MALIQKKEAVSKEDLRLKIDGKLHQEMLSYCEWAGFENDLSHFVQEAANFVLSKDKDWKAFKKSKNTTEVA